MTTLTTVELPAEPARHGRCYQLPTSHPLTTLDELRSFAERLSPEQRKEAVPYFSVLLDFPKSGPVVTLLQKEVSGHRRPAHKLQTLFSGFRDQVAEHAGKEPVLYDLQPGVAEPQTLLTGLAALALFDHTHVNCMAAPRLARESLVVTRPEVTDYQASRLHTHLMQQTTAVRWAVMNGADGTHHYFHYADQPERNGNAGALGESLNRYAVTLRGFGGSDWPFFVPDTIPGTDARLTPGDRLLKGLHALIEAWPELVPGQQACRGQDHLLALLPVSEHDELNILKARLLILPRDSFRREFRLSPEFQDVDIRAETHSGSQTAHDAMIRHLRNLKCAEGYRLELRKTHFDPSETWQQTIEENLEYWTHQDHLHRELMSERPTLWRFCHSQLPEMAALLREVKLADLHEGRIQYGCFLPTDVPAGVVTDGSPISEIAMHYLYFPQGTQQIEQRRGIRSLEGSCMKFWLDPFWARFYPDDEPGRCLVFTPERNALFPTMHGWDAAEMDEYLQRTLQNLLSDDLKDRFGEQPLYVFDHAGADQERISISVLDLAQFVPFTQRLDWVNDHLDILDTLCSDEAGRRDFEEQIRQMACHGRWEAIQRRVTTSGRAARELIRVDAAKSRCVLEDSMQTELGHLNSNIADVVRRLKAVHGETVKLNNRAQGLRRDFAEVQALHKSASGSVEKAIAAVTNKKNKLKQWEESTTRLAIDTQTERTRVQQDIQNAIDELSRIRDRLEQSLRAL